MVLIGAPMWFDSAGYANWCPEMAIHRDRMLHSRNRLEFMIRSPLAYDFGEVRVRRLLGSFDCGRILNPKTGASQFRGGMIMGLGLALTEETPF